MDSLVASHATIRIRVIPVGHIRRSIFANIITHLQQNLTSISLADLTPNVSPDSRSEFTAPTFPNGQLRLSFVTEHDHAFSTLEEFQASRSIFALLGIAFAHNVTDDVTSSLSTSIAGFHQHTVPTYPSALVHKCVLVTNGNVPQKENVIQSCYFVSLEQADDDDQSSGIKSVVNEMATLLLLKFNQMAQAIQQRSVIQSPPRSILGTPKPVSEPGSTDSQNEPASPQSPLTSVQGSLSFQTREQKLRKKSPARALKLVADLLLLAGKLPAAIDKYLEAMDLIKPLNDPLWLAACMDGLYCTMLVLRQLIPNAHTAIPSLPQPVREWLRVALHPEIESKFREIAHLYVEANAPVLLVDLILRTCSIIPEHLKAPALNLVSWAISQTYLDTVPVRIQLAYYIRVAKLALKFGFVRKQALALAFALRALVQLLNTFTSSMASQHVSNISAVKMDPSTQFEYMHKLAHLYGLLTVDLVGWPGVQTSVLDLCIQLTDAVDDPSALNRLIVLCFKRLQDMLSMPVMLDIVARLQRSSGLLVKSPSHVDVGATAPKLVVIKDIARQFAFLKSISIIPPVPELVAHKRPVVTNSNEKDPFLYSAFAKRSSSETVLVAGESVSFTVELSNPFSFTVTLHRLVLLSSTDQDTFKCDPINVTLPAHGNMTVVLRGTPNQPGALKVLGCAFMIFGVHDHCTLTKPEKAQQSTSNGSMKRMKLNAMEAIECTNETTHKSRSGSPVKGTSSPSRNSESSALEWTVVAAIPVIHVRPSGAAHRHIMLLEGETYTQMVLNITNVTDSLCVSDLVVQVTEKQQVLDSNSGMDGAVDVSDPIAVHDRDKYELAHAALTVIPSSMNENARDDLEPVVSRNLVLIPHPIDAKGKIKLPLRLFGKRHVTGVAMQVEYGEKHSTHLRRATCELAMTVVPSIEVINVDISRVSSTDGTSSSMLRVGIDLANKYSASMHVTVTKVGTGDLVSNQDQQHDSKLVPPGSARRVILTVPRCALTEQELTASVPEIKVKQFIMTQHGQVPPDFRQRLMCFWLREYLVQQLTGKWISDDGRQGEIDMYGITVHKEQIPLMWKQSIDIQVAKVEPILKCPCVYNITLNLHNYAHQHQSFLVQVHTDPVVQLLGHPVHLVSELDGQAVKELTVSVLVTSVSVPVWLVCHVCRVANQHAIEHVSKLMVTFC